MSTTRRPSALFQSTPPVKAATNDCRRQEGKKQISIHAAREGGDPVIIALYNDVFISIHAAREGGDGKAKALYAKWDDFNPRRP